MATMIPAVISDKVKSPGEIEIFHRLKDDPSTSEWIVLHSLDVANHRKQISGEIDFVVIVPYKGVLCIEVKACRSLRRDQGAWYYGKNPQPDRRGPFKQASQAMHSIRETLSQRHMELSHIVFFSSVILPYVRFNVQSPEWHPWQVIDSVAFTSHSIGQLVENVLDQARKHLTTIPSAYWFHPETKEPTLKQCKQIVEALRPDFEIFENPTDERIKMVDHITNRDSILDFLRQELVGPSPQGAEIECTKTIVFDEAKKSYGPWRQKGSGEEILLRDFPTRRYGVGVLYPLQTPLEEDSPDSVTDDDGEDDVTAEGEIITEQARKSVEEIEKRSSARAESDSADFDLSTANSFRPSSMGVSFLASFPKGSRLIVEVSGGRYRQQRVLVKQQERTWWLRTPVSMKAEFSAETICTPAEAVVRADSISGENLEELELSIELFSRPYQTEPQRLITVSLVNRKDASHYANEYCLFQAHFTATVVSPSGEPLILPYPTALTTARDPEEQSLNLLYRKVKTFAIGHGCAADWDSFNNSQTATFEKVAWVSAESLPQIEIPSTTPDIKREDGTPVEVAMAPLAGLVAGDDGFAALKEVIDLYEAWIEKQEREVTTLDKQYREAAKRNMQQCRRSAARMREGLAYLRSNPKAFRAFQLANHAIVLQQIRPRETRSIEYNSKTKRIALSARYIPPDPLHPGAGRGKWRAFQIAFLLMSVRSTAEGEAPDRETVELIWFPTGGGKTEAYLGLAAFAMFMRRLNNSNDAGVQVLMRYTLRLLTAQQFQRASRLICAMEVLRRQNVRELGKQEFSIGIWLGNATTPNTRSDALKVLRGLAKGDRYTENKFILSSCPWCGAQIGSLKGQVPKDMPQVVGYEQQGKTVVSKCFDPECEFKRGLPVVVIDQDIYQKRPSLVIGTVDKFAMLAWKPEVRALFGINQQGERIYSPPGLIIQDELHLISGPLGSMVGLYEAVIEELCTDNRVPIPVPPKIVCSTATIRRYADQIKALYAREDAALFPAPGLEAGDSFFARYARDRDGSLQRGRIYVGVHAPGLGSMQTTQVRTFTSLLQASVPLSPEEQDPWWTLLTFFNSLRELGTTLSLFQSDIPDYLLVLRNRLGVDFSGLRSLWNIMELTGRLRNEEVPKAMTKLEVRCKPSGKRAVDVCLASNIIEVGIDIDRLSLMAVVGQPKTTSQYIQVTGRVGRRWWERPGLVVTLYGASKARDRSHFEKFRSYHEHLYAQVEPTSVTPFSPPVLDRALHAIMVSYVRQVGDMNEIEQPYPYPSTLLAEVEQILMPRIKAVDPMELKNFQKVFKRRAEQWDRWERTHWQAEKNQEDIPLLRYAGAYVSRERARLSWATATSMRNVDAECQAEITPLYVLEEDEEGDVSYGE